LLEKVQATVLAELLAAVLPCNSIRVASWLRTLSRGREREEFPENQSGIWPHLSPVLPATVPRSFAGRLFFPPAEFMQILCQRTPVGIHLWFRSCPAAKMLISKATSTWFAYLVEDQFYFVKGIRTRLERIQFHLRNCAPLRVHSLTDGLATRTLMQER
jgi:hypothetical protein